MTLPSLTAYFSHPHPHCGLFHECLPLGGGRVPWEHVTEDVMPSGQLGEGGFLEEGTWQLSPEELEREGRASKGTCWGSGA